MEIKICKKKKQTYFQVILLTQVSYLTVNIRKNPRFVLEQTFLSCKIQTQLRNIRHMHIKGKKSTIRYLKIIRIICGIIRIIVRPELSLANVTTTAMRQNNPTNLLLLLLFRSNYKKIQLALRMTVILLKLTISSPYSALLQRIECVDRASDWETRAGFPFTSIPT